MATFAAVLSRHRGVRREILAALSGGLLVLSFPKFGHGGVAFLAVAPLLLGVHGTRPVRALRLRFTSVSFLIDRGGVIRFVHAGGEFHRGGGPEHAACNAAFEALEAAAVDALDKPRRHAR